MANNPNARKNLRNFKKNDPRTGAKDPRINRAGARTFDAFRKVVQEFLDEPTSKNRTRLDKLLMDMTRTQTGRRTLLEYAFGKVPQPITGKDEQPLTLNVPGFEDALRKVYGDRVKR